jgi:hypothetical protein
LGYIKSDLPGVGFAALRVAEKSGRKMVWE